MHDAEENEVLYGRRVITPKLYLHQKYPKEITKGFEEWYKIARYPPRGSHSHTGHRPTDARPEVPAGYIYGAFAVTGGPGCSELSAARTAEL